MPRFHFRPVLTLFCLAAIACLCALGVWQLDRLAWKKALIEQVESRLGQPAISFEEAVRRAKAGERMEYAPVTVMGVVRADQAATVFGTYEAAPGGYIFVPVSTASGGIVYVNQGFVTQGVLKDGVPADGSGEEETETITGLFRYREQPAPPASWFQTQGKSADGLWFIRDPLAFAEHENLSASPYYVDQFAVNGREWPKGGTTRVEFSNRHFEYALTWFGLAATLAGVWLVFSLQKRS